MRGGLGPKNWCTKNKVFPANFVFPHDGHFGLVQGGCDLIKKQTNANQRSRVQGGGGLLLVEKESSRGLVEGEGGGTFPLCTSLRAPHLFCGHS